MMYNLSYYICEVLVKSILFRNYIEINEFHDCLDIHDQLKYNQSVVNRLQQLRKHFQI